MDFLKKTRTRSKSTNNPVVLMSTLSEKDLDNSKDEKVDNASNTASSAKDSGEAVVPPSEDTNCENTENEVVLNSVVKTRKRKASEAELDDEGNAKKDSNNTAENEDDTVTNKAEESTKDVDSVGTDKASKANESESSQDSDSKGDTAFEKASDSADSSMMEQNEISFGSRSGTILGKGKRARIPNKRYSDIILTPASRTNKSLSENGEKRTVEKMETDKKNETETFDSADSPAVSSLKRASTGSPFSKKPKLSVDLSNPSFSNPFKHGWKRELVYRATNDSYNRRNADIYYYTPSGKKVRSMREVAEHLHESSGLTMEDFTFFKEPLGLNDPDKEIIRDAKIKIGGAPLPRKSTSLTPVKVKPFKMVSPRVAKTATPKSGSVKSPATPKPNVHAQSSTSSAQSDSPGEAKTASRLGNFKIKLPPKKGEKKPTPDENIMQVEKESPLRSSKRPAKSKKGTTPKGGPMKKRAVARVNSTSLIASDKRDDSKFMLNYLQHLSYGYKTLLYVFQYLKVQDLLRARCVCTLWRDLGSHPRLWSTVRMKNSPVHSFDGLANTLKEHGTTNLDLRKMLLPNGGEETWPEFNKSIAKVTTLRKIELCRCPASVIEQLSISNPNLEIVNALAIKCETMNLDPLGNFTALKELRLKSTSGLSLSSDLSALKQLTTLQHLSLTSIRDLNKLNLEMIAKLTNLDSLDLGECMNFPENFGKDILAKLPKLEKLRLEKGQGTCHIFEILEAIKDMPQLEQLELVNFDIKAGFDKALGKCSNIKRLLIIPTYISQSATTNHMVLGGVLRLQKTLSHFVWGVTLELLRVTEIFVDQCEEPDKKDKKQDKGKEKEKEKKPTGTGDSIPVLKPVPVITEKVDIPPAHDPPQVEILPLPNLQKLLLQSLPTTRVKILKIPFHATWRQSISDSVN